MYRRRNRKAQQIMNFLMNYGWAILIVAGVISALSYFGIFDAKESAPSTCMMGPGFSCKEYKATEDMITLAIVSGVHELSSVSVGISGAALSCGDAQASDKGDDSIPDTGTLTNMWWFNSSGVELGQGKKIARFVLSNGCIANSFSNNELRVYYVKSGESVEHFVDGRANLKVE